jgi:CheY-like chemotaxis protein
MGVTMTKILLVEDDKSLREIYGVRLLAEGYDIVSAGDGEEALAMAIKERPQLIVSDVMMPKISGFDMLDILRSTSETKDIKVIMMTALSSEDQRARGEALGADRYLVKSQVGIEDVVRTVHDVLADAPVNVQTAQQAFGTPAPSAIARPAAPVPPRPVEATITPTTVATPAPVAPVTAVPVFTPVPEPAPIAAPVVESAPMFAPIVPPVADAPVAAPAPMQTPSFAAPAPEVSTLPQPTAPFSTPRPGNGGSMGGDRVIEPLTPAAPAQDVADLMNQELQNPAGATSVVIPPLPPAPTA